MLTVLLPVAKKESPFLPLIEKEYQPNLLAINKDPNTNLTSNN